MKEVHIIAKGSGWDEAPEEGETWGVNDVLLRANKLSMCFHMHDMDWIKRKEWHALKLIIEKAEKNKVPIMTIDRYDWIPTSVKFPLNEIVKKFKACYFGSSIDYMVAYAIYKEFEVINLYGVNMVLRNEYHQQKPSMEFWIGMAMGLGYKVNIHAGRYGAILKTYDNKIYGYNIPQFNPGG
jgi:hypothetical protein